MKKKSKEKQKPVQGRLPDWMKVERMRGTSYLARARDAPNRICLSRETPCQYGCTQTARPPP